MQKLGHTRSSYQRDHLLLTPDTFIRAPLPGMRAATAIIHVGPAVGAAFTQYTVEMEPQGAFTVGRLQTFLWVLEGEVTALGKKLTASQYAYLPAGASETIVADQPSRVAVIERPHDDSMGTASAFTGDERSIDPKPLMGDDALGVRTLVPDSGAFDFAVNTMTFQPGASLPMVEIHIMEHGLLMLEGEGIYRLNEYWYPVTAGDFIYMAPYCPQWFCALGKKPAKYLIYKDWNRHPFSS
jgi:(S)-ureidoglycine aminohydrolase